MIILLSHLAIHVKDRKSQKNQDWDAEKNKEFATMKVYLDVHNSKWKKYKIDFNAIVNNVVGKKYQNSEVSIILTDDKEIKKINRKYRNINKPTNVLSFELGDDILLGDIYISLDTVQREAITENISVEDHCAHMVVHGVLHLLGYDHINDQDATVMENKETQILKKMGIKNPYASDNKILCADGSCCPGEKTIAWIHRHKIKENGFAQYALYALFGGVAALGFAPFYMWWWTIIGIAGAYWLTIRNTNNGGFWRTLLHVAPFGAVYCLAMFWWTLHSIYVVPELTSQYAVWTVPGVIGLCLAGVFIFSWPFVAVAQYKVSSRVRPVLFACVWALVLWGREWIFTGFPWNPVANIAINTTMLANSMAVWGALGLSFIIVGICTSLVEVLRHKRSGASWGCFVVFLLLAVFGCMLGKNNMDKADVGAEQSNQIIRIVQPSFSQEQKATHNRAQVLKKAEDNLRYLFNLANAGEKADVIIFPETSYPFAVLADDDIGFARALETPVIMGANTLDRRGVFNSMVIVDEYGDIQKIYSKSHLVPFGEYKPLGFLPSPVNLIPGKGPEVISVSGINFVPAICYEIIFSDSLLPDNASDVNAIINITNDNWFGNTPGSYQHLDMVRRYAIESGLPVVRANYSGISAFVASDGQIISSLPIGETGVLDGYIWGSHTTVYRQTGLNIWMIIILLVTTGIIISMRNKN